jgi:hypothetical protein
MVRPRRAIDGFLLAVLLAPTGCQSDKPLNHEESMTLDVNQVSTNYFGGAGREQTASVVIDSNGVPIDAWIVLPEHSDAAFTALQGNKVPANFLTGKEKTPNPSLEAQIPPKKTVTLYIRNSSGQKCDVKLKVTSTLK